ncbi:hypothetical protein [Nocardia carnea]|uniref:hypothetical protein n=1 Tax=Nocardia carnea TaxID=37328 RepID=UPI002455635A|nr:hypothetical protein [Nocardia carnea]
MQLDPNVVLRPGQTAPVTGAYECDTGCGHIHHAESAGRPLPELPFGCRGDGWRLPATASQS